MDILVSDLITSLRDYARNQSLTDARAIRTINQSCDFVFSQLGIPQLEHTQTIRFTENQAVYPLSPDFLEPISLTYWDDGLNRNSPIFRWKPMKVALSGYDTNIFSHFFENNAWNAYIISRNTIPTLSIDTFDFDNSVNWIPSNNAQNVQTDNINQRQGAGCLTFRIVPTIANIATLTRNIPAMDIRAYRQRGIFYIDIFLPTVNGLNSIGFQFGSNPSNFYTLAAVAQADGTPFVIGWNTIAFDWNAAVEVGSPNPSQIINRIITFNYNGAVFAGGVGFRLDDLRLGVVDLLDLKYYTRFKGRNAVGVNLYDFTAPTDRVLWGNSDLNLRNILVAYAATILSPQLLNADDWIKKQHAVFESVYKKRYPRRRIINQLFDPSISLKNSR